MQHRLYFTALWVYEFWNFNVAISLTQQVRVRKVLPNMFCEPRCGLTPSPKEKGKNNSKINCLKNLSLPN